MKKLFVTLTFILIHGICHADPVKYVQISTLTTPSVQPGTTKGFFVSSGTASSFNSTTSTITRINGDTLHYSTGIYSALISTSATILSASISTASITTNLNVTASSTSIQPAGTTKTSFGRYDQIKILQVSSFTVTTSSASVGALFVATHLSGSITPSSASSKILLMYAGSMTAGTTGVEYNLTFLRATSNILGARGGATLVPGGGSAIGEFPASMIYVDSPNTTSSTTYTVGMKSNGTATLTFGDTGETSSLILVEINGL